MIDIHTHPVQVKELFDQDAELITAVRNVFGLYVKPQPLATFIGQLDEAGIEQAVILPLDCTTAHGSKIVTNEQIAWLMEKSPRFIGFASVDPHQVNAPNLLEQVIRKYGLQGLKLDPALQQFYIANKDIPFDLYRACTELDIPLLMHFGLSWAPLGKAYLAHPLALEEVMHHFPKLRIIISHFGWPWVDEAVMLALKYQNIYIDTSVIYSGTPFDSLQRVFTRVGFDVIERSINKQVLFGSNYPRVDPKRVANAIKQLELSESTKKRILHDNAASVLNIKRAK